MSKSTTRLGANSRAARLLQGCAVAALIGAPTAALAALTKARDHVRAALPTGPRRSAEAEAKCAQRTSGQEGW